MVVLHVLNSLMIGGREKVVVDLCNNIDFNGNEITILSLSNNENILGDDLNEKIKLIALPFANTKLDQFFKLWFFGVFKVIREIRQLKPDIIHLHLYYHHFLFLVLCIKISGFKHATFRTVHTSGLFYSSEKVIDKFRLAIEKFATWISKPNLISISDQIYFNNIKYFGKNSSSNVKIPNGVDLNHFNRDNFKVDLRSSFGFDKDDVIGIYISRLDIGKNHELLISVWKQLVVIDSNLKLLLVGGGVLLNKLVERVNEEKLEKNIFFVGYSTQVAEYISIANFGIFPSSFEGFPISLIEKMAMGLPMIVSDIDVFKEVIVHNKNGKIFSLADRESLVSELLDLINDKLKQKYISDNAHITALQYDIKKVACKTMQSYKISIID